MALKAILDSLDGIPDDVQSEYVEKGGKFELQVEGMKTQGDVDRLQGALTKERGDHKKVKDRLGLLGERKVEDVVTELDRIPELEAAAAAAGGADKEAINTLVEARIGAKLAPVERERDTLKTQVGERDVTIGDFQSKDKTRAIHDMVRGEATKAKLLPEAMEDALLLADKHFEVAEDGAIITRDKVGVTPGIEASVWLTDMQEKRPHWWGESSGGGAGGNRGGGGAGGINPWTAENWNMTEQGKLYKENKGKAEQLAKTAGTTIGGQKPAPKK